MKRIIAVLSIVLVLGGLLVNLVFAETPPDIQAQIKDRSNKLQQLNQEIQATQTTLNQVQKQKSSLQKELQSLDTSIKQLDLNIQADGVAEDKLGFELASLNGEMQTIAQAIDDKRVNVAQLFREMQRAEDQNLIAVILSSKSLSASLDDAQKLESLRAQFSIDILKLNQLSDDYRAKAEDVSSKKSEVTLHQENLTNRKAIVEDKKSERQVVLDETKNQESVYQQKITDLKKQQDSLEDEITQMENQLGKNFNTDVLPTTGHGVLSLPLQSVRITQHFGERSSLYRGKPHNGLDLGGSVGTPIFAAADGVVMAVDNNDQSSFRKYQYGKYVLIKHANNLATLYGHMSKQVAFPGQVVKRGDLIGYMGATGYATGPHLHLGLYWAPSIELKSLPPAAGLVPVGVVLNPEEYL